MFESRIEVPKEKPNPTISLFLEFSAFPEVEKFNLEDTGEVTLKGNLTRELINDDGKTERYFKVVGVNTEPKVRVL